MTDPLSLLWAVLESPDPIIALSAWNRLPVSSRAQLDEVGLVAPYQCSEIICPACDRHHRSSVLELDSPDGTPRHVIACPVEGQVELTHEQRVTRSIEVQHVAEAVAASLELEGQVHPVIGDRLMFCGYVRHHSQRVEVYLGRGLTRRDGLDITACLPQSPLPQVVWVPSNRPLDGVWDTQKPPAVLTLAGMTRMDNNGLVVFRGVFESTARELVLTKAHPEHMFAKCGDGWSVCFQGSQPVIVKHTKGMGYLARLLEFPERSVSAANLHIQGSDLHVSVLHGSAGPRMDEQALGEIRTYQGDLAERLVQSRRAGDPAEVLSLEEQGQALGGELRGAVDLRGKLRERTDKEAARTSVSRAIGIAIRLITQKHSQLGQHLKGTIRTGHDCVYEPQETIFWVV